MSPVALVLALAIHPRVVSLLLLLLLLLLSCVDSRIRP